MDDSRIPICYDDDDDEYSFATQEYLKKFSSAITPDLPKSDSLIMEDKHLDTIPESESDELIKSSVEDLVHTPSESDGISKSECDLPVCDDSSPKKDEVLDDIISIPPGSGNDHFNAESSLIDSVLNRDNAIYLPPKDDFFSRGVRRLPPHLLTLSWRRLTFLIILYQTSPETFPSFCFPIDVRKSSGNPTSYTDLSLLDYEAFFCDSEPDSGDFTMGVVEDIFDNPTREPRVQVPNVLPTHPTLQLD
ncbi:hypothetical protein Tco_1082539 [Tanacetum coccineum]|uniref:Uncharacterized protein n=1 Tax=Tanacetum coccineum TaxID=301880 RepID=A0ABQ5I1K3_9ASTR